jgi:predicted nucleic acid-binding protein
MTQILSEYRMTEPVKYLIDTNVISELRKQDRADPGVLAFVQQAQHLYLSVITIGELRRGVELIRHRGDVQQADLLEEWLEIVIADHVDHILDFTIFEAQVWGKLRAPNPHNALDKQIAATALSYGLTLVTRNVKDFADTGVCLLNPFTGNQ